MEIDRSQRDDLKRIEEWSKKQDEIKAELIVVDTEQWQIDRKVFTGSSSDPRDCDDKQLSLVAGFDLSFPKSDPEVACVATVVCRVPDLEVRFRARLLSKVVHKECYMVKLNCPYVPGFLAFREAEFVIQAYRKMESEMPELIPQAILIDGNGMLHKRGCGLACHVGVSLNVPTVGVAKNLFHVDGIQNDEEYKEKVRLLSNKGDSFPLIHENGQQLGVALKSCTAATKPIYVSIGHKISLETACWLVNMCSKFRVPEPIRQADMLSREYLRQTFSQQSSTT